MFEVMGSKAYQLLLKVLHPVSSMSKRSSVLTKCSFMVPDGGTPFLENEDPLSCLQILSFTVNDPRLLAKEHTGVVSEAANTGLQGELEGYEVNGHVNMEELSKINSVFGADYNDLWDANKRLCCPLEESVLCMERHHQRLSSFYIGEKSSEEVNTLTKTGSARFCPILLLRRNDLKDAITRWSVVLPLSWVKAFWIPLVSNGAQAIGLREKSWIATEAGVPNFPSEFPECDSYSSFMEAEAAAFDKEASLRPPSVRPMSLPIPPPWDCIRISAAQICFNDPGAGNADTSSLLTSVDSDKRVVARTSSMLAQFLNAIDGGHLLLFPRFLDKQTCISQTMKDEKRVDQGGNVAHSLKNQSRSCFVRVILHAYKDGVIEEGAVICAPRLEDIKLWKSSSNNKVELQIPQSSMSTYFVKQASGKWEFQVPEDAAATESNRWPIGFVTSGFVRGSKKPSAGALCEAILLARLRHEQWSCVPWKRRRKEIYVLTRNLRSTAYRLALATIVLENQQDDLDSF